MSDMHSCIAIYWPVVSFPNLDLSYLNLQEGDRMRARMEAIGKGLDCLLGF
jgi:hypothetical protein